MDTSLFPVRPVPLKESWLNSDPLDKEILFKIPPRFRNVEVYPQIIESEGYFITGDIQAGKSTLAASIFKKVCYDSRCANVNYFFEIPLLMEGIKDDMNKGDSFYVDEDGEKIRKATELEKCLRSHFLVLDDLGSDRGNLTEWEASRLWLIINHRYSHKQPYIVTSNLSLNDIYKKISYRIAGRLSVLKQISL